MLATPTLSIVLLTRILERQGQPPHMARLQAYVREATYSLARSLSW